MKRGGYAAAGLAAAVIGIGVVITRHAAWWPLVVFAIAPDITLLIGGGRGLQKGQLNPTAVPFYNAVHRYWGPAVLLALMLLLQNAAWVGAALAWIAHVSVDRSLGFGLRTAKGFQRTEVSP
jgi:Domain of unknown function (DUF4260)